MPKKREACERDWYDEEKPRPAPDTKVTVFDVFVQPSRDDHTLGREPRENVRGCVSLREVELSR